MARRVYPRRYAQAVFSIALERGELDRWQSDLKRIASLGEDAVFRAWLESPKFHFDDKAKLVSERLSDVNTVARYGPVNLRHPGRRQGQKMAQNDRWHLNFLFKV